MENPNEPFHNPIHPSTRLVLCNVPQTVVKVGPTLQERTHGETFQLVSTWNPKVNSDLPILLSFFQTNTLRVVVCSQSMNPQRGVISQLFLGISKRRNRLTE